jgi:hypothetical protein
MRLHGGLVLLASRSVYGWEGVLVRSTMVSGSWGNTKKPGEHWGERHGVEDQRTAHAPVLEGHK